MGLNAMLKIHGLSILYSCNHNLLCVFAGYESQAKNKGKIPVPMIIIIIILCLVSQFSQETK